MDPLVPFVKAVVIMDGEGNRLSSKYYARDEFPKDADRTALEAKLFRKTKHLNARSEAEIIMLEQNVAIYRVSNETRFFVIGSALENELILTTVLDGLYEALQQLLRGQTDRRSVLDALELVILTMDEVVDGGHVLEVDPNAVVSRVLMRGSTGAGGGLGGGGGPNGTEVPLAELTIGQALASAREQFIKSMGNQGGQGGY